MVNIAVGIAHFMQFIIFSMVQAAGATLGWVVVAGVCALFGWRRFRRRPR